MTPDAVELRAADGVPLAGAHWPGADREIGCLVAHGFTGHSRNADVVRISQALAAHGFGVLVVDFRGHGRSGGYSTAGGDEVHDVAAGVAWLREAGYRAVATLGWSMGGSAVLRHAGLGGDADAVVSVSAAGTWFERGTRPMRIVHWMFEKRLGRTTVRVLRRTRIKSGGWPVVPEAPAEVAGAIAPRPLLVVHGDSDHYFPVHHVESLSAAAPTAQVWLEAGMGHAEAATTPELLDRIATWITTSLADREPAGAHGTVCDDDPRD